MPSNLPLSTVIVEIISHTPGYVWAILAALVVLGSLQLHDHVITRARLALAPVGMGALSLWGATMAFGARTEVIAAWALGIALALVANRWLQWPRNVRADGTGRFAIGGSPWPLIAMLAVLMIRYAIAVTLVFHHEWARDPFFSFAAALVYGAISGLFAARALRILRSAGAAHGLAAA